jgi:DNA polymerase-1
MSDRQQEWYLFHYTPPIGMGPSPVLILTSPTGETRKIEFDELSAFKHPLVTHSFTFLVDWFRRLSLDLPVNVIDIEAAKRLLVGRPKSDFSGTVLPWDMSTIMLPYLPANYDTMAVRRALSTHLAEPKADDLDDFHWMLTAARAMLDVWRDLVRDLSTAGEYDRFLSVEVPAYQVMLQTQLVGIRIDATKRDAFLSEVESQYITAHHSIAVKNNIHIDRALHDTSYLATCLNLPDIQDMDPKDVIVSLKDSEPVCAKLHDIDLARRNKTILLRTFSLDNEFCYPVFDTMGTVTGRILAVDPHLQYLKKAYRSMLVPRANTNHIYIDYSQFEPNIMANMSRDPVLLDLCATNDLYAGLAERLFGSRAFRKQTKTLFLAYSYGMGRNGLESLIRKATGADSKTASSLLDERFYGLFAGTQKWRESLHKQLFDGGRIGTAFGNYRYRIRTGGLDVREERWSVSQVVQGTGSLILKRLILKISTLFPKVRILLPMHDALLIEIPDSGAKPIRDEIVDEFIAAFSETCPGLEPQVTVGPFTPQEEG